MIKKNVYLIIPIFLLLSVLVLGFYIKESKGVVSSKINSYFRNNCKDDEKCLIVLSDITKFSWDRVFFFQEGIILDKKEFIEKFGNIEHGLNDSQIIFTLNNKVVYSERLKSGIENKVNNQIIFDNLDIENKGYSEYSIKDAVFFVEKQKISEEGYFVNGKYFIFSNVK